MGDKTGVVATGQTQGLINHVKNLEFPYSRNDEKPLKDLMGEGENNVIRLNLESFPLAADCEVNCRTAGEKWERPTKRPSEETRGKVRVAWTTL